ncbi:MAG: class I SAM-dependent methyltransferase [Thiotrichales bacterium]
MLRIFFLLFLLPLSAVALEQSIHPGINASYENADPEYWRSVFENEQREVFARRKDILRELDLKPGQDIADVGAGTGFFSLLFADAVKPDGKVYAVDITPNFIESIKKRAAGAGLKNLRPVLNTPYSLELPKESVDLVFISDTYHHFEYPESMLYSIYQAMRPDARLIIIDYKKEAENTSPWVMRHVRPSEKEVIKEVSAAGFKLEKRVDMMQTQYFLVFSKEQIKD